MERELFVDHEILAAFAADRVNLPKSEVDEHRAQVERLRDHLKRVIENHEHYKLIKTLHSGSVRKGTALRSISDMDVAAYLDASQVPTGKEADLISELASILRSAYGGTKAAEDFEEQTHSVKVHFHGSDLDVDVAPIVYEGKPDDRGYLITREDVRVETSIPLHLEFIRKRKAVYGKDYAQIVRFLKYWAREQRRVRDDDFRCKSFLLELIVAHLSDSGTPLSNYRLALENIFGWMVKTELSETIWFDDYYAEGDLESSTKRIRVYDPVNPTNNVCAAYTVANHRALVEAANDAFDAISAAHYGNSRGYAVEQWQRVFGATFRGTT